MIGAGPSLPPCTQIGAFADIWVLTSGNTGVYRGAHVSTGPTPAPGDWELQAGSPDVPVSPTSGGTVIVRETPTGSADGSNATFVLAHTPIAGSEQVFVNGIAREPGADYTLSDKTITMLIIPDAGGYVRVNYRY